MEKDDVIDSPREKVSDHIRRYLNSDGDDGYLWNGVPTLLLTTRGRKSERLRRTALIFGKNGDNYLIVASKGGAPQNPLWFENIIAEPKVTIQVKGEVSRGHARLATPQERASLWSIMTDIWPAYDEYQAKTTREIPLVVIEVVPS